jgi:hypothetical protein
MATPISLFSFHQCRVHGSLRERDREARALAGRARLALFEAHSDP